MFSAAGGEKWALLLVTPHENGAIAFSKNTHFVAKKRVPSGASFHFFFTQATGQYVADFPIFFAGLFGALLPALLPAAHATPISLSVPTQRTTKKPF